MLKKLLCVFVLLLVALPVTAAPSRDEATVALVQIIWKSQTMDGLNEGVWVMPESAVNQYFATCTDDDRAKNANLKLLDDNKIYIAFDSSVGRVGLTCDVVRFVHNQTESYAELYVRKKEVDGRPFVSWMMKYISLGGIVDLYGNPLKDVKQVETKINGNSLRLNFRPLMEEMLLTNDIGRKIEIDGVKTRAGALEFYTNMKAMELIAAVMGK